MGAALAAMCVLLGPGVAKGAEYKVSACGASAGYQNHLLGASASDSRMSAYTACPNDGDGHYVGLAALAGINRGTVPFFSNAMHTFLAPEGTTIGRVHLKAEGRTWNGDWSSALQASNDRFGSSVWNVAGCSGNPGSANGCVSALGNLDQNYDMTGATGFRSVVGCGKLTGCATVSTGYWPYTQSYYFIHEFDVTLNDFSAPSIALTGGGLVGEHWVHGTQAVRFSASDNSGIYRTRMSVDDLGVVANDRHDCDFTYAVPCVDLTDGEYSLDTARVGDGEHHVGVEALDATDYNGVSVERRLFVDNHAPAEPSNPSVVGGQGWHTTDGFTIRWTNPPSAAPIDLAYYEICRSGGTDCATGSQTNGGVIDQLTNLRVGQPGDYTIRVWLKDSADNVSEAKTALLHLKFDNVAPAQAAPQHRNGWVDKGHSARVDQQIDPPVAGAPPVSGIAGYAVTADGSTPGNTVDTPANGAPEYSAHRELEDLPEGVTIVKARAISGAGIPSPAVGSADIHVDLTPPALSIEGQPDGTQWRRTPVALVLTAEDPDELSGMASGPDDRDIESGGYIEYAVDGSDKVRGRGPRRDLGPDGLLGHAPTATVDIPVTTDGTHTVGYRAFDVAGNTTAERSMSFKIDQTPPELAVFEAQQRSDPRLVTVAASDRTSGLADGGRIQLRRIAPSDGTWITLRTTREDDRYYAHVDNTTLPEGDYEFRAFVPDQAGNEATATTDRDGRNEVVHISPTQIGPYVTISPADGGPPNSSPDPQDAKATVDTKLTAAALQRIVAKKCKRPKRTRAGTKPPKCASVKPCEKKRGKKKCPRPTASNSYVHELRVPFGKRASTRGKLATAGGSPIAGAEITVLARPAMAGGDYVAESAVRTDSAGQFKYSAPAGAGRTLDFHYRGDGTYKHADDQVTLRVPAAATIKASKHAIRNGRRVRFTGRLLGRPYPAKGKVLDLQAFYRHKWRTFATPRASLSGRWAFKYRFQATRGTVLYKFRIRVRATSDYPYELGYSKVTRVRVTSR